MSNNKPKYCEIYPKKNSQNDNSSDFSVIQKLEPIRVLLLLDCLETQQALAELMRQEKSVDMTLSPNLSDSFYELDEKNYDIIITDYCDSKLNSGEIIPTVKQSPNNSVLILLTGKECVLTEVDYLGLEADYVMRKPVKTSVLFARLKAIMRGRYSNKVNASKIGPFEFHMDTKSLVIPDAENIKFTVKETRLLQFLLRRRGGVVTRADLLTYVWGYNNAVNTHTVETHVYRIRKKLNTVMNGQSVILTEKDGYRLAS